MRVFVFVLALVSGFSSSGQFSDSFSDGDFQNNPTWNGDVNEFLVVDNRLRSNGPESNGVLFLSTSSEAIDDAEWQFTMELDFAPSNTNKLRVYLVSDQLNLENDLNGYFIEIGQSGDDHIKFYRQDAEDKVLLFTGTSVFSDTISIRVRVTRDQTGKWEIYSSSGVGSTFNPEGSSFVDRTHRLSMFFGIVCFHSSSRRNLFFFDDFEVSGSGFVDEEPPVLTSLNVISQDSLTINFSEAIEVMSAQSVSNYHVNNGIGNPVSASLKEDGRLVSLSFSSGFTTAVTYQLSLNGIEDLAGNVIVDSTIVFEYLPLDLPNPEDVVINEFLAAPSLASGLPNAEYIELFNRSTKNFNLEGWTLSDRASSSDGLGLKILRAGDYLILVDQGDGPLYDSFGEVLEVGGFPSLNNSGDDLFLADESGQKIFSISYTSATEGISYELINPYDPCISSVSLVNSLNPNGGTPGGINSVFDDSPDITPPVVSSFTFTNFLVVNFSEMMDAGNLSSLENYSSPDLPIQEVRFDGEFPNSVVVFFSQEVVVGQQYKISIQGITDCTGNEIETVTLSFGKGRSPGFNDLIFTEVLFDEVPSVLLPEREFLELYNTTNHIISTYGLKLTDATSSVNLPVIDLEPDSYYILTSTAGVHEFNANAIGVVGFPSLNNSGELLTLSLRNELICSVDYDPDWHDVEKSVGGFSLELVDLSNPCVDNGINWRSSVNPAGGTPGQMNSHSEVLPDNFGPSVQNAVPVSSLTIKVDFDEKIHPGSTGEALITLQPNYSIDSIYIHFRYPKSLFVNLDLPLEANRKHSITISGITDCSGNEVSESTTDFALPIEATADQIKLSEVLFNPRKNGVDFVEIYNDSDDYLSLQGWQLARVDRDGISDRKVLTNQELVLDPSEYLVFTVNSNLLLSNYPKGQLSQFIELNALPPYANDTGNVVLLNNKDEVVERFFYDESYHSQLLESSDGVSLERISFSTSVNESDAWRSAASTAGFATPGYENSQTFALGPSLGRVRVEPKVFIPGNSGSGRDFTTISYQFGQPGQSANVTIYDQNGRLVRNLAEGALLSTSGFLRWDGETNSGAMARMGYYVILFQVYSASGKTETIKETVAVGRDF